MASLEELHDQPEFQGREHGKANLGQDKALGNTQREFLGIAPHRAAQRRPPTAVLCPSLQLLGEAPVFLRGPPVPRASQEEAPLLLMSLERAPLMLHQLPVLDPLRTDSLPPIFGIADALPCLVVLALGGVEGLPYAARLLNASPRRRRLAVLVEGLAESDVLALCPGVQDGSPHEEASQGVEANTKCQASAHGGILCPQEAAQDLGHIHGLEATRLDIGRQPLPHHGETNVAAGPCPGVGLRQRTSAKT
mmetsp:Transcript_80919/g.179841  ORF Transcript_80919/g.179841 Transcript_80919/m.179841 type:complete len:250 (-) Transcript_80919:8-757(-)